MDGSKKELRVYDAMTRQLLHTWPLPTQEHYCGAQAWSDDSTTLILPFGGAWKVVSGPSSFAGSGFTLLAVHKGHCLTVMLPEQLTGSTRAQLNPPAFAGRYVAVAQPRGGQDTHMLIFSSSDGSHAASWQLAESHDTSTIRRFWAPSGEIAAWAQPLSNMTFPSLKQNLCIWHPAVGPPLMLAGQAADEDGWCAWSPTSDAVLVHTDVAVVTLFDPHGQLLCPPVELGFFAMYGA